MAGVSLESQLPLRGGGQGAASPAIVTSSQGNFVTGLFISITQHCSDSGPFSHIIWTLLDMRLQNYHWSHSVPQYLSLTLISSFLSAKNKTQLNFLFEQDGLKIIQYEGVTKNK